MPATKSAHNSSKHIRRASRKEVPVVALVFLGLDQAVAEEQREVYTVVLVALLEHKRLTHVVLVRHEHGRAVAFVRDMPDTVLGQLSAQKVRTFVCRKSGNG